MSRPGCVRRRPRLCCPSLDFRAEPHRVPRRGADPPLRAGIGWSSLRCAAGSLHHLGPHQVDPSDAKIPRPLPYENSDDWLPVPHGGPVDGRIHWEWAHEEDVTNNLDGWSTANRIDLFARSLRARTSKSGKRGSAPVRGTRCGSARRDGGRGGSGFFQADPRRCAGPARFVLNVLGVVNGFGVPSVRINSRTASDFQTEGL